MPQSRKKGERDFSDCKFRSLLSNLPAGIQHMLDRAFDSLGTDANVLQRWTAPVVTKEGKTVQEKDWFPHAKNDICCADGVAFVLHQSGVVDLGRNKDYFRARKMDGKSMAGTIHWAHYYYAHADNADVVYELPTIEMSADPSAIDYRDWLPGDVFVYFDKSGDPEGDHVNIYLGPFIEVVDGQDIPEPVYHMWNSSIGTGGVHAFCTAGSFAGTLRYCKSVGRTIHRARVKAIERLFRNQIAAPIVLEDGTPKPGEPPRAEIAWRLAETSGSPYPLGRNLTWHEGIHLGSGAGVKSNAVECFAPGELVLVRFGSKTRGGDSSFVLTRHRMLPSQGRLLGAPPLDEKDDDPAAKEAKPLYSLYMQLAPLSTFLDESHEIEPGIAALVTAEPPPDHAIAPEWLQKVWLKRKPALIDLVPDTAPLTLLALTRSGPDAAPKLTPIGQPKGLTARLWHALSDLESVTVDGTKYWLLPVPGGETNAGVWDTKIPPATVPKKRNLAYYNPRTDAAFDTPIIVGGSTVLAHESKGDVATLVRVTKADGTPVTGSGGTLIRTVGHGTPGITMTGYLDKPGDKDQYDWDPDSQTLVFHANVKKIVIYTETEHEGDKRAFDNDNQFDFVKVGGERMFRVRERANTGPRTKVPRAWLDLAPGVWMTDDEIATAEKLLADRDTTLREGIKARLAAKRSCLVGVKTNAKSGWTIDAGHVAAGETPESGFVTIYRRITGKGTTRAFTEPPKDATDEQEQTIVLEISPPGSDVAIYPLLVPQGRVQSAVFELVFAATETGTNQAEIDAVVAENKDRKPLAKKLLDGTLVDLRSEPKIDQTIRNVGRERIGEMGEIAGAGKSVHFELFAGENLVDASVTGTDGAIVPVPKTPWLVYKDAAAEGFFSKDFVQKFVKLLRAEANNHRIDLAALEKAFGADDVVQPAEWIEFCAKNHRALSRLITVHKPEWKTDWSAEVASDTRGAHMGKADRDALKADVAQTHWWKDDLSLEGIASDDVFFYHPLRFIEWLNTGIDFVVAGTGGKKPKVKVQPLEGGAEVELTPDAKEPGLHRFRTFVGEGAAKTEAPFRVTLENVDTATPKFTVLVKRGELHTVRLIQPSVTHGFESPKSAPGEYHVPVKLGDGRSGFLLADGNAQLEKCGYDETTVVFKVNYNVRIPKHLSLALEGDASFKMRNLQVDGAKLTGTPGDRSAQVELSDDAKIAAVVESSVVEGSRMYTVRVDVGTSTTAVGKSAKLVAKLSGGDLTQEAKFEIPIATRTIAMTKKDPPKGEDVAKLQLYLSQLFAEDDLPCFRSTGKVELTDPKALKPIIVDGVYGKPLARALWRFIYTYGRVPGFRAFPIATKTADGSDGASVAQAEVVAVSAALLEGKPPTKALEGASSADDLYAKRVGAFEKKYDHYPVVGEPLIAAIVERFKPPFVLPHVDFFFEETTFAAPPDTVVEDDWNRDGRIGKSTLLPISGDTCRVKIAWKGADAQKDGDLPIVIELLEASAYRFLSPTLGTKIETTLRTALKTPILTLYSSQTLSSKPADNVIVVRTKDGRKIGERQLHGSRDLLKAQAGDGCRDAAMMQAWLAKIADTQKPGEKVYKNMKTVGKGKDAVQKMVIDGKWNAKCVAALKLFHTQYSPATTDFPALALALRTKAG
jgi:hypothetical protein